MRVRQARTSDFADIMGLYHEASDAMAGTPYDCCWRRDGHPTPEFVRGLITAGGVLVAERDGTLVGAVGLDHDLGHDYRGVAWLADVPDEFVCVIHLLVVRMSERGRGLSRTILRACLEQAVERSIPPAGP